jgi:hypothetical protein
VTYGIVQEHAGTIEVSSTVGVGTVFRLELPSAENAPERRTATKRAGVEGVAVEVEDLAVEDGLGKVVHV